jgi:hypothetical protein
MNEFGSGNVNEFGSRNVNEFGSRNAEVGKKEQKTEVGSWKSESLARIT